MLLATIGGSLTLPAYAEHPAERIAASGALDVQAFLDRQPGPLKGYRDGKNTAAQIIAGYGTYYNLDPRVTLALLELVPHLLSDPNTPTQKLDRPFGSAGPAGFTAQIDWMTREVRAGFGPYDTAPVVWFTDGTSATLALNQDSSVIAVQRFVAQGRSRAEWNTLKDAYPQVFQNLFGAAPETVTPVPQPVAGQPFLSLPWPKVYPKVAGDPLSGKPVQVIHSSYFDHVYPTVDRGSDGNNFIVTYLNRGNVSYNTHDGHDYYFPERPTGTPIVAAADGIAYALTARGNGVVIKHGGAYAGYETVYWHLNAFDRKFAGKIDTGVGVQVRAGDYLGVSGKSGFTDGGAHLHFEVRHNRKQVDPYGWWGPGSDPCAAWTAGCEASVWLWKPELQGYFDFTPPGRTVIHTDTEPPIGTLSIVGQSDLSFLAHLNGTPIQSVGNGSPLIEATGGAGELAYGEGVQGQAVQITPRIDFSYPISGNLSLKSGTLSLWAKVPEHYTPSKRQYLFGASNNPGDEVAKVYTGTFALRHQSVITDGKTTEQWNFWTVGDTGLAHNLVVTDTLKAGWHHFAVTWNSPGEEHGSTKRLYIDGALQGEVDNASFPTSVGNRLEIGRWLAGYGNLDGSIDELAIFSRGLTTTEIERIAQKRDYLTDQPGPVTVPRAVGDKSVILDTNAIDRQGGIVSTRLRRDNGPWSEPMPYFDSYRWSISGTTGLHTFSVEYRDRSNNTSVVTASIMLSEPAIGSAQLTETNKLTGRFALKAGNAEVNGVQVAATLDFDGAVWQPIQDELLWNWTADQPRMIYLRFRTRAGLIGAPMVVGPDTPRILLPLISTP